MIDNDMQDAADRARAIFGGLAPSRRTYSLDERVAKSANPTMPIILVGTMAMSLVGTATAAVPRTSHKPSTTTGGNLVLAATSATAKVATLPAPASYTVVKGDTVSGIAGRYGLSTTSVLSRNGLTATSTIYPGQVLKLTSASTPAVAATPIATAPAAPASPTSYVIAKGDTVSRIAARHGVSTQAVLTANGLVSTSIIYPGQKLAIPGAAVLNTVPVSNVTPTPVTTNPVTTTPKPVSGSYVIQSGDNLSKIAAKFGVTLQAVLDANGLTRTSIIYTGRSLVIPGVATTTATAGVTKGITLLADDQAKNAATIIAVGRDLGVPDYGIVIALATAMQESSLRNISYGHLDSVGLFQQRPSAGWGTVAQLTTATHAARLFYGGPSNPNKGVTKGLLDVAGWQSMTLTQAAQKVQVSAFPTAYAKWEASARLWFSDLT
jgi:N-acetylmuramoyl-L-alanine amidase